MKKIFLVIVMIITAIYADFSKSGNIVTDSTTVLQWQDDAIGSTMTWAEAIDHCEDLTLDAHSDWRLPNLKELTSLVDDSRVSPSINIGVFEYTESSICWSSTTYAGDANYAWSVNFNRGYQSNNTKSHSYYVRCVRAGQ